VSSEDRRGTADVDAVREHVRAARQRRGGRDDTRGTVLGAVVRMLDTPPITEESEPSR
jgi:hypothetical protein